ncbi:MAG: hypothetical protein ACYCSN_13490 [Acidobacteriaceae bacterium]
MTAFLVHPFSEARRIEDRQPTNNALEALKALMPDLTQYECRCEGPNDYATGLRVYWELSGDMIICEHDIVPTEEAIRSLLACHDPVCTVPYILYPESTGLPYAILSVLEAEWFTAKKSSLGLVKLSASWRARVPKPDYVDWRAVDIQINKLVDASGLWWHLHLSQCIKHNHQSKVRSVPKC